MNPAVIGTDVVERDVRDGVLHTHRLVSSKWYFPKWAQAVSSYMVLVATCDSISPYSYIFTNSLTYQYLGLPMADNFNYVLTTY